MTRLFPPSGSTTRGLVALLGLVLGPALCPAADDALALEVSSSQVIHAAVASGLIGEADFETIDDPMWVRSLLAGPEYRVTRHGPSASSCSGAIRQD